MGYSISWLAVRGKPPERLQEELGLKATTKTAGYGEAPYTGHALKDGWYLLVMKGCDHAFIKPKTLTALSAGCDIVACSIEEHVMFSAAEEWRNGACLWRVEHAADRASNDLKSGGKLPAEFEALAAAQEKRHEAAGGAESGIDFHFEIPLKLAKQVAGFKHDEANTHLNAFQVFDSGEKKSWWKFGS